VRDLANTEAGGEGCGGDERLGDHGGLQGLCFDALTMPEACSTRSSLRNSTFFSLETFFEAVLFVCRAELLPKGAALIWLKCSESGYYNLIIAGATTMIKKISTTGALFAAAFIAGLPTQTAQAEDGASSQTGFYILGRLGSAMPTGENIESGLLGKGEYVTDDGIGAQGAVGYHLGNGWRAEVSYTWLQGSDGDAKFPFGKIPLDGEAQSETVLFNILKTVGTVDTFLGTMHPFVGAGVGFSHFDISDITTQIPFFIPAGADSTDTVFAAAVHFGFDSRLAEGITLTSQWSVQYADDAEFPGAFIGTSLIRESQFQIMSFTGIRIDLN
jgi:opacity protein-like surface antigen